MSFANDSANVGLVPSCSYMSWSLSSLMFNIVQTVGPSGLCRVACVCFVGCCASSYWWVRWMSSYGLMWVLENVRFGDLHPQIFRWFSEGVRLFVLLGGCIFCRVLRLQGRVCTP